jgi:hypothetical protein
MVNDGGFDSLTSRRLPDPPTARSNIFAEAKHCGEQSCEMARRRRAGSAIAGTFAVFATTAQTHIARASHQLDDNNCPDAAAYRVGRRQAGSA